MEFGLGGGSLPWPGCGPAHPGVGATFVQSRPLKTKSPSPLLLSTSHAHLNAQQSCGPWPYKTVGAEDFLSTYSVPATVLASRDIEVRARTWMRLGAPPGLAAGARPLSLSASCFLPPRMGKGPHPVGSLRDFRSQSTQSAKLGPPPYVTACERRPSLGLSLLLCEVGATAPLYRAVRTQRLAQVGGFNGRGSVTVLDYSY